MATARAPRAARPPQGANEANEETRQMKANEDTQLLAFVCVRRRWGGGEAVSGDKPQKIPKDNGRERQKK
jgi:ribosomal protein L22